MDKLSLSPPLDETITILNSAVEDIGKLFHLHLELLRAETKKSIGFTKRIAALAFLLVVCLIPAVILFLFGLSSWLEAETQMPSWQCQLLVATICLGGCVVLAFIARSQIQQLQSRTKND